MTDFSAEELKLVCLYDPGSRSGLIYELRSMEKALMPDEQDLKCLTEGVIRKMEAMSDLEYELLSAQITPPFDTFPFDDLSVFELCDMED